MLSGFRRIGVMGSDSLTPLGTVLIMRSNKAPQESRKKSLDAANFRIMTPPSDSNTRRSDRVVTLWPDTSGFLEVLMTCSMALARPSS